MEKSARNMQREEPRENKNNPTRKTVMIENYGMCKRNFAARLGVVILDGCRMFTASGAVGTAESLFCEVCGCHRNYHEVEIRFEVVDSSSGASTSGSNNN